VQAGSRGIAGTHAPRTAVSPFLSKHGLDVISGCISSIALDSIGISDGKQVPYKEIRRFCLFSGVACENGRKRLKTPPVSSLPSLRVLFDHQDIYLE
jgi:hypothetical protein